MSLITYFEQWGSLPEERNAVYPCDDLVPGGSVLFRAVDVNAPVATTFRWLCQMKAAPYSYDWIDNHGRQSPRKLIPGLEKLEIGQRVMEIFRLTDFSYDEHMTLMISSSRARKIFGTLAVTYRVIPKAKGTRIVVKLIFENRGVVWHWLLAFGDFLMMRKQLLTIKSLAELST